MYSIFVAFGLGAPLALTFSLLRRGWKLLWVGVGLMVLLHHHALRWIREQSETGRERGAGKEKGLEVFTASWPPRWTRPGSPRPGDCWDSVDETPGVRQSRATPTLQSPHLSSLISPLDHLLSGVNPMYIPKSSCARKKRTYGGRVPIFLEGTANASLLRPFGHPGLPSRLGRNVQ